MGNKRSAALAHDIQVATRKKAVGFHDMLRIALDTQSKAMLVVGRALDAIRKDRMWELLIDCNGETYVSFHEYTTEICGFGASQAYHYIGLYNAFKGMNINNLKLPSMAKMDVLRLLLQYGVSKSDLRAWIKFAHTATTSEVRASVIRALGEVGATKLPSRGRHEAFGVACFGTEKAKIAHAVRAVVASTDLKPTHQAPALVLLVEAGKKALQLS